MPTHKNMRDKGSEKVSHYTYVCLWSEKNPQCSSPWSRTLQEDTWGCSRLWVSGQSILLGLERSGQVWLPCSLDGSVAPVRSDSITLKSNSKRKPKIFCYNERLLLLLDFSEQQLEYCYLNNKSKVSCFVLSPTMEWRCHVNISEGMQTFNLPRTTEYRIQPPSYNKRSKIPHILLKYTAVTVKKWRCKVNWGLDLITGNLQSHTALSWGAQTGQPNISSSQTS